MRARKSLHVFGLVVGLSLCTLAGADEVILFDDFSGPDLDGGTWGLATWNIGDRTQFGNTPQFAVDGGTNFIILPLDTYNPDNPGNLVLGTEIYSLENFDLEEGVEYLARARLTSETTGLVAAFFTYNQKRRRGRWLSDEIDFEVLSKQPLNRVLVTSWNDWGAPGSNYEDGIHHLGAFLDLPGFDWRSWNTYAMRWYPDRVEWWLNEVLVHSQSSPVPDLAQPARASLWAGGTTWPDAYDPALAPVASPALNTRHEWQVDYIMVTRLGDSGGGGGSGPNAPSALSAEVAGAEVSLSWADNSSDEDGFNIYRAFRPRGNAQPDFNLAGTVPANTPQFSEFVEDNNRYLYFVTAHNADGESQPSETIEVTVGRPRGRN